MKVTINTYSGTKLAYEIMKHLTREDLRSIAKFYRIKCGRNKADTLHNLHWVDGIIFRVTVEVDG